MRRGSPAHKSAGAPAQRSAAGEDAIALAPPAYGIDFVDGGMPELPAPSPNRTGMPDRLKAGIEALSGSDLSDVRVHANSSKPAQLNALAYAQGSDIHVAPGQEDHLPHEAWHVAQQRQGRVLPTLHAKGVPINDDERLEKEADVMGHAAARLNSGLKERGDSERPAAADARFRLPPVERGDSPIQRKEEAPQGPAPAEKMGASRPVDPGVGEGIDLIFILTFAFKDKRFVKDYIEGMTSYVKNVLRADNVHEVKGVVEIFEELGKLGNEKVRRVRIVGHGWDNPKFPGQVLTRDLETETGKSTLINPDQVHAFAKQPENRALIKRVMRPDAVVEFWGCNLGKYPEGGKAWADLFQSTFVATTEKVVAREQWFELTGPDGKTRRARSSKEVDREGPKVSAAFNRFLLGIYQQLVGDGEIAEVSDDRKARIAYMRDMFDRSSGAIMFMALQEAKGKQRFITPKNLQAWTDAWVPFPVAKEDVAEPAQDELAPPPPSPQPAPAPDAASPGGTAPSEVPEPSAPEPPAAAPPEAAPSEVAPSEVAPPEVAPPAPEPSAAAPSVVEPPPVAEPPAPKAPAAEPPVPEPSAAAPQPAPEPPAAEPPAPPAGQAQPQPAPPVASAEPAPAPVVTPPTPDKPAVTAPARRQPDRQHPSQVALERQWEAEHREGAVTGLEPDHLILWNFGVNSAELKPEHAAALDAFARHAQIALLAGDVRLRINGHASRSGSARQNVDLAIGRASAAFNRLIDRGVAGERCDLDWHSSDEPWFPNMSGATRARNRRVELRLVGRATIPSTPEPRQEPEPPKHRRTPAQPEPELTLGEALPGASVEFKKEFPPKNPPSKFVVALGPYVLCYPSVEISGKYKLKTERNANFALQFKDDDDAKVQFKTKLNELTEFKVDSSGNFGFGFKDDLFDSELIWDWKKLAKGAPVVYGVSHAWSSPNLEYPPGSGVHWSVELEVKGKFALGPSPYALAQLGLTSAGATGGAATGAAATEGVATGAAALGVAEVATLGGIGLGFALFAFTLYEAVHAGEVGEQHARIFGRHIGFALRLAGEATGDYGYREALDRLRQGRSYYEDYYDGWRDAETVLAISSPASKEQLRRLGETYGPLGIDPFMEVLLRRAGAYDFKPLPLSLDGLGL